MRARLEDTRTRVRFEDGEGTDYSTKNISHLLLGGIFTLR